MPRSKPKLSVADVMAMYPTEDACADALFRHRYGRRPRCRSCGQVNEYYRISSRQAYSCRCGYSRIYVRKGTPAQNSEVPLRSWLWVAATLMLENRALGSAEVMAHCGVSKVSADRMLNGCRAYVAMEMLAK